MDTVAGYREASRLASESTGILLQLQTAWGLTPQGGLAHPQFFDGSLCHPEIAAAGLRTLSEIASTRYFKPVPGGLKNLDPVLTAHGDRLRCEAFSACNGVYARLDLLADSISSGQLGFGTTNIDINPPLATALAAVRRRDCMQLAVGPESVKFKLPTVSMVERKVDLPERWIRGFAETQAMAAAMRLRAELDGPGWHACFANLNLSGGSGAGLKVWLEPSGGELRIRSQPVTGAISLAGTARITAIRRLLHDIKRVRLFGPDVDSTTTGAPSAIAFDLPAARLTLMLSPEPYRGFSGEGALLSGLDNHNIAMVETLLELLAWEPIIDLQTLAAETRWSSPVLKSQLQLLAASGHVGFDLCDGAYFHRTLPFNAERVNTNYPRLAAAKDLLRRGLCQLQEGGVKVGDPNGSAHHVDFPIGSRCTCIFWAKYRGSRGPCKHILAAQRLLAGQT